MTEHIARTDTQPGVILRREHTTANLTQARLGDKISLRQGRVSKLESGTPATQLHLLIQPLAALDLELVIRPRCKAVEKIKDIF